MWRYAVALILLFGMLMPPGSDVQAIENQYIMKITYIGHATILIEMDGVKLVTDPTLRNYIFYLTRLRGEVEDKELKDIDAILISHAHWDHLDINSLKAFPEGTLIIVPKGVDDILLDKGFSNVVVLEEGDEYQIGKVKIQAVHAEHEGARYRFFGDEQALGYLITGSSSVYFAGDTALFPGMLDLKGKVDIALLPVWGWGPNLGSGHMGPEEAALAAKAIQPKIAIPIHWGTYFPIGLQWFFPSTLTQPPLRFRRSVKKNSPEVDVIILWPGESIEINAGY
jgi:L-ascorbate metabolism protein UlaG (beta-lactamase superfamily)